MVRKGLYDPYGIRSHWQDMKEEISPETKRKEEVPVYPELYNWLSGVKPKTRKGYLSDMNKYIEFRANGDKEVFGPEMATKFIDEAKRIFEGPRNGRVALEGKLKSFYNWLISDYKQRNAWGKFTGKKGIGPYKAKNVVLAIKSFYSTNYYPLKWKPPKSAPKKENERIELSPGSVRKMVNVAPTKRDATLILFGFQGGFDIATVCLLDIGDLSNGLVDSIQRHKGDVEAVLKEYPPPWLLHIVREKEGINFHTCIGRDAASWLIVYLWSDRIAKGEKPKLTNPLFTLEGAQKKKIIRIRDNIVQKMMRDTVVKAGIITEEHLERSDINIAGYHALRGSFNKRLEYAGMPERYVEYMMGHSLPYSGAYSRPNPRKLLDKYKEFSHVLEISEAPFTYKEIEEQLRKELEKERSYVKALEERITKLEAFVSDMDQKILEKIERLEKEGSLGYSLTIL